jgi:very-short-patch-repair endonuclease
MANLTEVVTASEWAGRVKRSKSEQLHDKLAFDFRSRRLPPFVTELRFAKDAHDLPRWKEKKTDRAPSWRFDFAWPEYMLAVEIEGLSMEEVTRRNGEKRWVCMGGHATPQGYKDDCEKYNAALELGWGVLRFEQDAVKSNIAIESVIRVLCARGWTP